MLRLMVAPGGVAYVYGSDTARLFSRLTRVGQPQTHVPSVPSFA